MRGAKVTLSKSVQSAHILTGEKSLECGQRHGSLLYNELNILGSMHVTREITKKKQMCRL